MTARRGKILVIRGGAIGDFILTLPAIAALRQAFPEMHLELLGYPRVAELARAGGLIDAFRSIEARPLSRFFARNAILDDEWAEYFESFNLIISYLFDPDEIFRTNVLRATKAQFIQEQHRPDEAQPLHATDVFLKPLERLAIFGADPVPRLILQAKDPLGGGGWLAAHPGSGSEKKNWPEDRWFELLRAVLGESDANVLLVGGEAEGDRLKRLAAALSSNRVRTAGNSPLVEVAGLISQCSQFVGHDSGITHLAAALGVPVVALWGPSRAEIWKPLGTHIEIVHSPQHELHNLDFNEVGPLLMQHLQRRNSSQNPSL